MDKYHFVFVRDRVGGSPTRRSSSTSSFRGAASPTTCWRTCWRSAAETVRVEGDRVIVRHVYTERRVTPLNIFLRDAEPGRRARGGDRVRQRDQGPRRGRHLHRRHAAQELRGHAERPGHLLRLRRALPALGVPLPPDSASPPDRGGVRGRALVLRGRARRVSRGVPCLPRPAGRGAGRDSSRRTATCSTWSSGSGCSAGWPGRRGGRVPLPPERPLRCCAPTPPEPTRARTGSGARRPPGSGGRTRRRARGPCARAARRRGCRARRNRARWSACRRRGPRPRLEAVDRGPEIRELVVGLVAKQPDAPLDEHIEVVLARPCLLLAAVRIERRVELCRCRGRMGLHWRGGRGEIVPRAAPGGRPVFARLGEERSTWEKSDGSPQ